MLRSVSISKEQLGGNKEAKKHRIHNKQDMHIRIPLTIYVILPAVTTVSLYNIVGDKVLASLVVNIFNIFN